MQTKRTYLQVNYLHIKLISSQASRNPTEATNFPLISITERKACKAPWHWPFNHLPKRVERRVQMQVAKARIKCCDRRPFLALPPSFRSFPFIAHTHRPHTSPCLQPASNSSSNLAHYLRKITNFRNTSSASSLFVN